MANQGDAWLGSWCFSHHSLGFRAGYNSRFERFWRNIWCLRFLQARPSGLNGKESVFLFLWVHNSISTAMQEMAADTHPVKSYILNMNPSLGDRARQRYLLLHFSNNKAVFAVGFFAHFLISMKTSEIFFYLHLTLRESWSKKEIGLSSLYAGIWK